MEKGDYFNSYQEFLERLKNPIVEGILGKSNSAAKGDLSFCDTPDFETAQTLAVNGDYENLEKMANMSLPKPSYAQGVKKGRKRHHDGEDIDIGSYVAGIPECMFRKAKRVKKYISVLTNGTSRGSTSTTAILTRGRMVLGLVYALQNAGYLVEIDWIVPTLCEPTFYDAIKIKRFDQYIPNAVLAYWLCNPSALRRHWFRLAELKPVEVQERMGYGYGRCGELDEKDIPPGAIYIPSTECITNLEQFQSHVLKKYT